MTLNSLMKTFFLNAALLVAAGCAEPTTSKPNHTETGQRPLTSYPLRQHFKCLPNTAAIIAAHRGTAKGYNLAENAKGGLDALINHGVMIAEIDVAKSKDGVHFLFHDGVWEDDSTGRGVVAATEWRDAEKLLLNDTSGKLTSETLISLDDYLNLAKDQIYLEIDFKSSAVYETVISMIRSYGMDDKVILIAYNEGQAKKLAKLAPDMMISASVTSLKDLNDYKKNGLKQKNIAAWTGRDGPTKTTAALLRENNIPILTYPSKEKVKALTNIADLIVSDYALDQDPIIGTYDKEEYLQCVQYK